MTIFKKYFALLQIKKMVKLDFCVSNLIHDKNYNNNNNSNYIDI